MQLDRRAILAGLACTAPTLFTSIAEAFRGGVAGGSPPPPGVLTTMTLVNTSGSTQAAGFITPVFGHSFVKGAIPSGTAPQFQVSGTPQPYSWGWLSYWSDGSLRHGSFMFRCTASVAGNGTLSVNVMSGGTAPTTSARTLTEVYAQSIVMVGVGAGTNFALSGTWSSWLNGDANQTEAYVYMDGNAGKVWRVKSHFATSVGGTPHGQLECYHYIAALTDSSNALGGFRHIGRITQPYYSLDTPAKDWRSFTSISWQHGSGPTTVPLNWPFTPVTFTATGGVRTITTPTNNFYCGTLHNGAGNMIACTLSSTGTLPAGLSPNIPYLLTTNGSSTTQIYLRTDMIGGENGSISPSDAGSGVHTVTPLPMCCHFGAIWTADTAGKPNFFQGTGSMTADGTIRTQFNQTYLVKTGTICPYDLSVTGVAFGGTILDNSFAYNWTPISCGPISQGSRGSPGGSTDIGQLTTYHAQHFYNQSAVSDLVVRSIAFTADQEFTTSFRDHTTGQYPNLGNSSYTGVPAPSSGQQDLAVHDDACDGFTAPLNGTGGWNTAQNASHKPSFAFYAALVFGDPHFMDLCFEEGTGALVEISPVYYRNPGVSANYTGAVPTGFGIVTAGAGGGGARQMAWANRDLQYAALLAPLNHPDGTQISDYLRDIADANATYPTLVMNSTQIGSYMAGLGRWNPVYSPNAILEPTGGGFMRGYFLLSMCAAAAREHAGALAWLSGYSVWLDHVVTTFGGWCLYGLYDHGVILSSGGDGLGPVADDAHYGVNASMVSLGWTTGNPAFTAVDLSHGYVVTVGDKYIFDVAEPLPANFSSETPYYVRDVSGNTFNLAATSSSNPKITPSNSGTITTEGGPGEGWSGPWVIPAAPPAASTGLGAAALGGPDSYLTEMQAAVYWALALGATGFTAVKADTIARIAGAPPDFTGNPNFLFQDTFG